MAVIRYITHPNVAVDPDVPVTEWGLSAEGRRRAAALFEQPWIRTVERIVSSDENKAVETAQLLAGHLDLEVEVRSGIGENDRTATGFVPPDEFEQMADAFFERPTESVRGWERAIDAQARVVTGLADLLDDQQGSTACTIVVGHGAVGTLWFCHLTNQVIDRRHDQPGQGHYYTVNRASHSVLHAWHPIDEVG